MLCSTLLDDWARRAVADILDPNRLAALGRLLSRGSNPAGYPTKLLAIDSFPGGSNPPLLMVRAFGAHLGRLWPSGLAPGQRSRRRPGTHTAAPSAHRMQSR
jgi:hypothetical protein